MTYTILASICQHPIRQSSRLPWSGSTLDFDVRYCSSCSASRSVRTERQDAEREFDRSRTLYDSRAISRSTYRENRRRYDNARLASTEDQEYWEDRGDRERRAQGHPTIREEGRRFAGLDDPEWLGLRRDLNGYGRETRFAGDATSHRRESQYREQPRYRRSSRQYEPGRHADRSGSGYYNTSNPMRWEDDLDALSDRELEARRAAVSRALSRYR